MTPGGLRISIRCMPRYLLDHRHQAGECPVVFASWRGFDSPLRHHVTVGSCLSGGHAIWWQVEAPGEAEALAQLPRYVAERTTAAQVSEVEIP
jgi:hypothetical protein